MVNPHDSSEWFASEVDVKAMDSSGGCLPVVELQCPYGRRNCTTQAFLSVSPEPCMKGVPAQHHYTFLLDRISNLNQQSRQSSLRDQSLLNEVTFAACNLRRTRVRSNWCKSCPQKETRKRATLKPQSTIQVCLLHFVFYAVSAKNTVTVPIAKFQSCLRLPR